MQNVKFYSKRNYSQSYSYDGSCSYSGSGFAFELAPLALSLDCADNCLAVIRDVEIVPIDLAKFREA